jgi:hypothetical protein
MVKDAFLSPSATSSLNEANESSATFASTFLANDKFVRFLEPVRIRGTSKLELELDFLLYTYSTTYQISLLH